LFADRQTDKQTNKQTNDGKKSTYRATNGREGHVLVTMRSLCRRAWCRAVRS